jgi:predicted RNA-binding Zn ribbon-like protein
MLYSFHNENSLSLQEKWLCIDFVNTVNWHASSHPEEGLKSYSDLISWSKHLGLISETTTQELLFEATARPEEAQKALDKALSLRECIYRFFLAHLKMVISPPTDLVQLNDVLSDWFAKLCLEQQGGGFGWVWKGDTLRLDSILGPIAQSAASLLCSSELSRVGICADENGCGWLFFDTSRNHSRRWCDMQGCGNRAKARQHYEKEKLKPR